MNYKEYFKQQLVESIIEETFAETEMSHGAGTALDKAKYFKGLMGRLEDLKARAARATPGETSVGRDPFAKELQARTQFATGSRVKAMAAKHMGALPAKSAERFATTGRHEFSFRNPVVAGRLSPKEQKEAEGEAARLAGEGLARRRADAREKKFTI